MPPPAIDNNNPGPIQVIDGNDAVEEAKEDSNGLLESVEEKMSNTYHSPKHGDQRGSF